MKKLLLIVITLLLFLFVFAACSGTAEPTPSQGLTFTMNDDGMSCSVSGIGTCTDVELVIPSKYKDLAVTGITEKAFFECTLFESVTIPSSIEIVGKSAFEGCKGLMEVHINDLSKWCTIDFDGELANPLTQAKRLYVKETILTDLIVPGDVREIGAYVFSNCVTLEDVSISENVTSIGTGAFSGCVKLTELTIPKSVTYVGSQIVDGCDDLTVVYCNSDYGSTYSENSLKQSSIKNVIFGGNYVPANILKNCAGVRSVAIADSVTKIGNGAFLGCGSLEEIKLPDAVTNIGTSAFKNCYNLASITIPENVKIIDNSTFEGCSRLTSITIPNNVKSIGSRAFWGCTGLTSIIVPDNVTTIGESAFGHCTGLTSITVPFVGATKNGTTNTYFGYIFGATISSQNRNCVPASLKKVVITGGTSIGDEAFYACENITSITIPKSVKSIGNGAFLACKGLKSITLPEGVTSIGNEAFLSSGLTSIVIPASIKVITGDAYPFSDGMFAYCTSLKTVTFAAGSQLTIIGDNAFRGCSALNSITIPSTVKHIRDGVFEGCEALKSITIPSGVESIGEKAFERCTALTKINIPYSVRSIGRGAFYDCTALKTITLTASLRSVGDDVFTFCSNLKTVNYEGAKAQFDLVRNGLFDYYQYYSNTSIAVRCSDGVFYIYES